MSIAAERRTAFTTQGRLPGIYFLPPPEPEAPGLPPLDVAGFVGFAARGPLNRPVKIESADAFTAVFGPDLPVARGADGRLTGAYLAPAVRGFFANGGRRCYIVRAAQSDAAAARFTVPGIVGITGAVGTNPRLSTVDAAWPGAWANHFQLATSLRVQPLPSDMFAIQAVQDGQADISWNSSGAPDALHPGDVLRLTVREAGIPERRWLLAIDSLAPLAEIGHYVLTGRYYPRFERFPWAAGDPPDVLAVRLLEHDSATALTASVDFGSSDDPPALTFSGDDAGELQAADVLQLVTQDEGVQFTYLFPIRQVGSRESGEAGDGWVVTVSGDELIQLTGISGDTALPGALVDGQSLHVERLRVDLLVYEGGRLARRVPDAAFNRDHPRFWGEICLFSTAAPGTLRDHEVDPARAKRAAAVYRNIISAQRSERNTFGLDDIDALAGLLAPLADPVATYLPAGIPTGAPLGEAVVGPYAPGHEGLDTFDPRCFLDDRLIRTGAGSLVEDAAHLYYQRNERLNGLHGLIFVDEVALLSVPDSVHVGWAFPEEETPPPVVPEPPVEPPAEPGFGDCADPPAVEAVAPGFGPVEGGTEVRITGSGFAVPGSVPMVRFGARAASGVTVIDNTTLRCVTPPGDAPGPAGVNVTTRRGSTTLDEGFRYVPSTGVPLADLPLIGEPKDYDPGPLLMLQGILLDICQGRHDVLGVISLPGHFTKREILAWQAALLADTTPEDDLSYVAAYHPWIVEPDPFDRRQQRVVPPGGAVCGMIASRERERNVWIAPANVPIHGVGGLAPPMLEDDAVELYEAQINLLRREPDDYRAISAQTLSRDAELRQISVRRLMILLRKLAFETGMELVFENNDERLREWLQADLEALLRRMFVLGAFAGETEADSFRIVTDERVNTPQSVDRGQLIALIQVAPSQPTEFITVELRRVGGENIQAREV